MKAGVRASSLKETDLTYPISLFSADSVRHVNLEAN